MRLMTLKMIGAPRSEVGIIPLGKTGLSIITVKVKDPITIEAIPVKDAHELILRKTLRNLGVMRVGEYEADLVARLDPQVNTARSAKIQRHAGLFKVSHSLCDPGESPVVQLVFVSIDVKREGFFAHIKRLHRSWCRRLRFARLTKKNGLIRKFKNIAV